MRRRPGRAWPFRFAVLVAAGGCEAPPQKELVRGAQFGVFFGGQVQERREVPFEVDKSKQTLGFRIEFSEPLTTDTQVEWRVDRPLETAHGKSSRGKASPDPERVPLGGSELVRAGEARLDRTLAFEPGDPLGLWNVRVLVRGRVAIDRPFEVYDPVARAKAQGPDGGR